MSCFSPWKRAAFDRAYGLMGIVNLTPDSFYDGGKLPDLASALAHVQSLLNDGAAILDLGAESTRPGSKLLSSNEEIERLLPIFCAIKEHSPQTIISIDTWHSKTARFFLEKGADIINDVSGCCWDEDLETVLAEFKPGYVLMHSQGKPATMQDNPAYVDVVEEVYIFFKSKIQQLISLGLPKENIVLDPGIGFGKNLAHNLALMAKIEKFKDLGCPLLAGISMKSWLGSLFDLALNERSNATAITSALLWQKGVFWHRVHQPKPVGIAIELACKLSSFD